ncbi:alpha/beta fold hydrolase [Pelagovum pacificum]|uniref:Alpha/beta hydrolase n=1 Tax=Pelagovum pacificum TaxID=2588711 RepID=A0A5C5G9L4_9RHOB|nr:alpha/beta hydrolase [Pelagovum pacificum]QQA41811.1 alpha/beta hydrolase [Pelagovum pacificum]TNY30745.1 alpha/beta hydrolase [Pelagovum pacificum]
MPATFRWIETTGARLAAESFGDPDDPAVLLVMGATASLLTWPEALCEELAAAGHFVIRYDHRDTGLSTLCPAGAPDYRVDDLATDIVDVLDGFGVARATLVGMSLGGYLSQIVALDAPERVASLVLIASEPLGWEGDPLPSMSAAFLDQFAGLQTLDWSDRTQVATVLLGIERSSAGTLFDEAAARARIEAVLARSPDIAAAFNHAVMQQTRDWTGGAARLTCPTLLLHGTLDPVLPVANGEALSETIPGSRLVLFDGVGHELPDRILPRIVEEIGRHVETA